MNDVVKILCANNADEYTGFVMTYDIAGAYFEACETVDELRAFLVLEDGLEFFPLERPLQLFEVMAQYRGEGVPVSILKG